MKKEVSAAFMEHLKSKRVKSSALVDGDQVITIFEQALYIGTVCRCDTCPTVGTVNGGKVDAAHTREADLMDLDFCFSKHLIVEDVGCYDQDGSGDAICSECARKRDTQEKEES